MNPEQPANQIDLRAYAAAVWRRKWIVLLVLVAVPVAAYFLSDRNAKVYQASSLIQVQGPVIDSSLLNGDTTPPTTDSVVIAARLIQTTAVAAEAGKRVPPPSSPGAMLGALTVDADDTTGFITLTAKADSGARAAAIANAFAESVVARRARQALGRIDRATGRLKVQLDALAPENQLERRQLSLQIQRLRTLRASQGSNAQIIESAVAPGAAISPRPRRAALLGLVAALLLAGGLVVLLEGLDRRIRDADELDALNVPTLARVPRSAFSGKPHPGVDEAFSTLRTSLTYFSVAGAVDSLVITSPGASDGKTLVSINLAMAHARAGKDVVLIDADLRRSQIAQRIGGPSTPGLSDLLADVSDPESCMFEYPMVGPNRGRLRVLPSGAHPPNPSELLASPRMASLLAYLKERSDIVIVDTSPLLIVSDAVALLDEVAGCVLVVRLNATTREGFARARGVIAAASGKLLGTVVTGANERNRYAYGDPYRANVPNGQPSANGGGARKERRRLVGLGRKR